MKRTIYVDQLHGDDRTADGSQLRPFRTVNAACKSLGTLITDDVTIKLMSSAPVRKGARSCR